MSYRIRIEEAALKKLAKLESRLRNRITAKIEALADNPRPHGYKKLVDADGTLRIKVSGYRILSL
jgi:mRNA interferase RelE/StbE